MSDQFLMKGKVYGEHKHKLVYPVFAEVKYDEIRLHVHADRDKDGNVYNVTFLSYAGKPLYNLDRWAGSFAAYFNENNLNDLDMGVLVNKNFNDSYRWVRSSSGYPLEKFDKKTGKTAPQLFPHMVEFYLFDLPDLGDMVFSSRLAHRSMEVGKLRQHGIEAWNTIGQLVHSEVDLDALFVNVRERGFEGLMVKSLLHTYVSGRGHRTDGWLKMKPEETFDGQITGVLRAYSIQGEPLDRAGSISVRLEDGSYARPAGIAHGLGEEMYHNPDKYIGRWVEFKCMERDRQGGYRHPSFVRFREDKE